MVQTPYNYYGKSKGGYQTQSREIQTGGYSMPEKKVPLAEKTPISHSEYTPKKEITNPPIESKKETEQYPTKQDPLSQAIEDKQKQPTDFSQAQSKYQTNRVPYAQQQVTAKYADGSIIFQQKQNQLRQQEVNQFNKAVEERNKVIEKQNQAYYDELAKDPRKMSPYTPKEVKSETEYKETTGKYRVMPNPQPTPDKSHYYLVEESQFKADEWLGQPETTQGTELFGSLFGTVGLSAFGKSIGGLIDVAGTAGKTFSEGEGKLGFQPKYIFKAGVQMGAGGLSFAEKGIKVITADTPGAKSYKETGNIFAYGSEVSEFAQEYAGAALGVKAFTKGAKAQGVRVADYSGYRGIGFQFGREARGIIGIENGKIKLGTPTVKGELRQANTIFETSILEKTIKERYPAQEVASYGIGKNLMQFTEKTESAFTEKTFKLEIERISPEGNIALTEYIKQQKGIEVYGSTAQRMQSKEFFRLNEKGESGKPQDIDLVVDNPSQSALEIKSVLEKAGEKDIRISPENPALVEKYYADTKAWGHVVDIHPQAEGGIGYSLFPDKNLGLGFEKQKPTKVEGVNVMRLSEQGIRKGVSTFTPMTILKKKGFKEKGLELTKDEFAPEPHRIKDVGDFLSSQKALLESKKIRLDQNKLNPFASRTRAKIQASEYALGELKTFMEKKYKTKINLKEGRALLYEKSSPMGRSSIGMISEYSRFSNKGYPSASVGSYPSKGSGYTGNYPSQYKPSSGFGDYPSTSTSKLKSPSSPTSYNPQSPSKPVGNYPSTSKPSNARSLFETSPSPKQSYASTPKPSTPNYPYQSRPSPSKPPSSPSGLFGRQTKEPPITLPNEDFKKSQTQGKQGQAYNSYAKQGGKYIKVNKEPLTRNGALALMQEVVDNTSSATGKIRETIGKAKESMLGMFSGYKFKQKNNTYQEKNTYRIDTQGEHEGITVKGWLANRRKRYIGI